jgi:hypothetical protein
VPNLRLKVLAGDPSLGGAVGGAALPDVVTDSQGRYEIVTENAYTLFLATAPGSDHRFLCDAFPLFVPRIVPHPNPNPVDVLPVVHVSWTDNQLPRGIMYIPGTSVFGTVLERVGEATQPVADATVTFESGTHDVPAKTNAMGFYMACSVLGTDQLRPITASKAGYRSVTRNIDGGWDRKVDFELVRD